MIPSLRSVLLNSLSYEQTLLLAEETSLPPISWEEWREKAVNDFDLPPAYFDLPRLKQKREISGQFRYLEILTKFRLTEDAALSLDNSSGIIYGIYESLAGVIECLRRNDDGPILDFFFSRLRSESRQVLIDLLLDENKPLYSYLPLDRPASTLYYEAGSKTVFFYRTAALRKLITLLFPSSQRRILSIEEWEKHIEEVSKGQASIERNLFPQRRDYFDGLLYLLSLGQEEYLPLFQEEELTEEERDEIFCASLCSGNYSLLLEARNYAPPLIARILSDLPLAQIDPRARSLLFKKYKVPGLNKYLFENFFEEFPQEDFESGPDLYSYLLCAFYSCQPQLASFFQEVYEFFRTSDFFETERDFSLSSYYLLRNPLGFYTVNPVQHTYDPDIGDIDTLIDYYLGTRDSLAPFPEFAQLADNIVKKNLGNLDILNYFLPQLSQSTKESLSQKKEYPLTALVVSQE